MGKRKVYHYFITGAITKEVYLQFYREVRPKLKEVDNIVLHLNNVSGSVDYGLKLYKRFIALKKPIRVVVEGASYKSLGPAMVYLI